MWEARWIHGCQALVKSKIGTGTFLILFLTDAVFLLDSVLTQHQKVTGPCNGNVMHALLKGPPGSIGNSLPFPLI